MTYRPRVYTASNTARAQLWLTLREDPDWAFCDFTASWPAKVARGEEFSACAAAYAKHWKQDIAEIKDSDFVLLWGRDDRLKGALVEAGAALAFGLKVITIGLPDQHSWSHHPQVIRCYSLVQARNTIYTYTISAKGRKAPADD